MTTKTMIEILRYKADNVKAKIEPEFFNEVADKLEEYSQKEKLPCKIGEDVYEIQKYECDNRLIKISIVPTVFDLSMLDKFGKTVFLTREEAEREYNNFFK